MTDQPKWTPGPWASDYLDQNGQRVVSGQHIEICTCWHHSVGSIEKEMEANAHLIAAAPDLYAALEAAMAFIESHVGDPDITDVMIRNYRTLQDLRPRDVLAKARGETK